MKNHENSNYSTRFENIYMNSVCAFHRSNAYIPALTVLEETKM